MTRSCRIVIVALALVMALRGTLARAQCSITANTGTAFGNYDVYSNLPLDISGSVTYLCLLSLSVTIDLSAGSSGTATARQMTRVGGGTLNYNLYLDAARTFVWGNGTGGTFHYGPIIALLTAVTVPIFGRIPAGQDVSTGDYTDTVVITLNY